MARETTITTTDIGPTTITGGPETGGIITGGSTDIIRRGGRGSSSTSQLVSAEENAKKEQEIKIREAKEKTELRRLELEKEKQFAKELRNLSPKERQNFFRQANREMKLQALQDKDRPSNVRIDPKFIKEVETGRENLGVKERNLLFEKVAIQEEKASKDTKTKITLPSSESKFAQPTRSTRTDLTYRDVRPSKIDNSKVKKFVEEKTEQFLGFSLGGTSVGQVLDKPIVTIPETSILQRSTIMDSGTGGQTSPKIESRQFTFGDFLGTPVEISRDLGKTVEGGFNLFASGIEKIPGDIKSFGGTTIKSNIVSSVRIGGKVSKVVPELALFSVAPVTTSVSGFAFERGQGNLFGAGQYAFLGSLFTVLKIAPKLKIPKGKRGQASLEQINKNRFDKLKEALDKLERTIASKKKGKEQLKYIANLRKNLKTNLERENFDKYIQDLVNKEIVKVPKIDTSEIVFIKGGRKATTTQPKRLTQESPFNILDIGTKQKQIKLFDIKASVRSGIKTQQKTMIDTKQKTKIKSIMDIKTQQKIKQKMKTPLKTISMTATKPKTIFSNLVSRSISKVPKKKIPKRRIPIKIPTPTPKKLRDKLDEIIRKKQSVNIVTGMKVGKEKIIGKRLAPNRALKFAQQYVDKNIQASFRLKVNKKKPLRKDIKKSGLGKKFRLSRNDPLFLVEHRKYRLDSRMETRDIKQVGRKKLLSFR